MNSEKNERKNLKIVLTGSGTRETVAHAIDEVAAMLEKRAELILVDKTGKTDFSRIEADLILLFGGDGSLLNVARRLKGNQIPVLGVNFGKFGFLAELEYQEFLSDLENILQGNFKIVERMMLNASVERAGTEILSDISLNDVVISRSHFSRIIQITLEIDEQHCTHYHVDGLIISSPSGSTAHSLSAGGPIIHPTLKTITITPICPHTMTVRPLVVPGDYELKLTLVEKSDTVAATFDGQQAHELLIGDEVKIRACKNNFLLVVSGRRTFYDRLHIKLNWSGHSNIKPNIG